MQRGIFFGSVQIYFLAKKRLFSCLLIMPTTVGDNAGSTMYEPNFVIGFFPNGQAISDVGQFGFVMQSNESNLIEGTVFNPAQGNERTFSVTWLPDKKKMKFSDGSVLTSRTTGLNDGTIHITANQDIRVDAFSGNVPVSMIIYTTHKK